jgi:uncharacterized protein
MIEARRPFRGAPRIANMPAFSEDIAGENQRTRVWRQTMSHVAHELHEEFPEQAEAIHALKAGNAHFARIAEEYHTLNRSIHRMETDVEPADDATVEALKKKRLHLKDEIAGFLATV